MSDERITWVEIDVKTCTRRWGVGACTAALSSGSPIKCINGFRTCRATSAYVTETVTLYLTMRAQAGVQFTQRFFPCLTGVRESEQTVNIAGSDPRLDALGRRATVEVSGLDFVYEDRLDRKSVV